MSQFKLYISTTPIGDIDPQELSGVAPGVYGDETHITQLTVDATGRISGVKLLLIDGLVDGYLDALPDEPTPQLTDNVISSRGVGTGSRRKLTWQAVIDLFKSSFDTAYTSVAHLLDISNPHAVTKQQVGLGDVDNTSDAGKPVSIAALAALALKANTAVLGTAAMNATSDFATAAQGILADTAVQPAALSGLGNVDNTSDANKPVSTAQAIADTAVATAASTALGVHTARVDNPHAVTAAQIELGNVTNDAQVKRAEMGAASGVASLDEAGLVPQLQIRQSVKATYTGAPISPILCQLSRGIVVIPSSLAIGQQDYYELIGGVTLALFSYSESSVAGGLNTLILDNVVGVVGAFSPLTMAALTTLSVPVLASVGGNFGPNQMAALTTLSVPALALVVGVFGPSSMAVLTTLSVPALASVGGAFSPSNMAALTTLSVPALALVVGVFGPSNMAVLTTLSVPVMVTYGSTITINSSLGNVANVTLGTIGTLKKITGASINISGQKLTATSVNGILALLVSLDGTNGTTLFGSGKTVTLSGGTNAAPTGQGITDKATLIARGATITTT